MKEQLYQLLSQLEQAVRNEVEPDNAIGLIDAIRSKIHKL